MPIAWLVPSLLAIGLGARTGTGDTEGAVVETAVHPDGSVHPVHHPDTLVRKALQPGEVEVERVVEARGGPARETVHLDRNTATDELGPERKEELVPAAVRRLVELVKDREVPSAASRADVVGFGHRPP